MEGPAPLGSRLENQRGKPVQTNDVRTPLELLGGGGSTKFSTRAHLQELARKHLPIAIALVETRRGSFSRRDIDRLIGRN